MEKKQHKLDESNYNENDSPVMAKEKALILAMPVPKKDLDQTISNPDRYVSWYQYNTNNIDKYLQLCPHCKKPTLSAFHRSVIDSAIDYLNGKRMFNHYPANEGNSLPIIAFLAAIGVAIYVLLNKL
ncbi:MAG: hypothetical protein PVI82_06875 [Desulfobacterales bacterium]|jgi:hypothetical protein